MGIRVEGEPPYPTTQEELDKYCNRFIQTLQKYLGDRLISVHLCGSWARGEANPPVSDVDLMVVIDKIDEQISGALQKVWQEVNMGCANVVDLPEIAAAPTELMAMMSDCHVVLLGTNPFPSPTKERYAQNLADVASTMGLYARSREYYHWETNERKLRLLKELNTKYMLKWALRNLVAIRTGTIPVTYADLKRQLLGTEEGCLLHWAENVTDSDYTTAESQLEISSRFSLFAQRWLEESSSVRKNGLNKRT
jgi:predicted nucleotidyltransferase